MKNIFFQILAVRTGVCVCMDATPLVINAQVPST